MSGDSKTLFSKNIVLGLVIGLVILGIWGRFLPHPPNFAPITAVAIFAGAFLPRRQAVIVPLAAIIVSDMFIGLHSTVLWTWGSFALIAALSSGYLGSKLNFGRGLAMTAGGSVIFYLLSNFGVWLQGGLYSPSLAGLGQSYVNALPFFRSTLLGDMFYVGTLFGAYFLALSLVGRTKKVVCST